MVADAIMRLAGRVALVTGASRGIGAAVARRFASEGAAVALAHEPSPDMARLARALAEEIVGYGGTAVAVCGDLGDPHGPAEIIARSREELGPLDILVANAAATGRVAWNEIEVEEWDRVQEVNVRGTWLLTRSAMEDLIGSGRGSVVTVTSIMARTGQPGALHYTASKAAIIGMTRALARELGPHGVRVNSVMPGAIQTEHEYELGIDSGMVAAQVLPLQALQRRGVAEDLAGAFAFLASDDSSFITGQVICVDGGWVTC